MAPTNPIGRDPVTGLLTEFVLPGNILDGGSATSTYVGGPVIDCGRAT